MILTLLLFHKLRSYNDHTSWVKGIQSIRMQKSDPARDISEIYQIELDSGTSQMLCSRQKSCESSIQRISVLFSSRPIGFKLSGEDYQLGTQTIQFGRVLLWASRKPSFNSLNKFSQMVSSWENKIYTLQLTLSMQIYSSCSWISYANTSTSSFRPISMFLRIKLSRYSPFIMTPQRGHSGFFGFFIILRIPLDFCVYFSSIAQVCAMLYFLADFIKQTLEGSLRLIIWLISEQSKHAGWVH